MHVVIAGASGFVGTALTARLRSDGHEVTRLVRRRAEQGDEVTWSPANGIIDFTIMDRADAVVNLSGESISKIPWTKRRRAEILSSRVSATRSLADAMRQATDPPTVFLSGSAVGFYGDRPAERLDEHSAKGEGFLADVVERWEACAALAPPETRTVMFRTGVVMGRGGAMKTVSTLTNWFVSGRLGTGGQHWPWISLHDEVGALVHLLDSSISGPVNLAGPRPATADHIMSTLAERMRRPYLVPIPERALELTLGDAARELLLSSQKVVPAKLIADGYRFTHPTAESAIDALLDGTSSDPHAGASLASASR